MKGSLGPCYNKVSLPTSICALRNLLWTASTGTFLGSQVSRLGLSDPGRGLTQTGSLASVTCDALQYCLCPCKHPSWLTMIVRLRIFRQNFIMRYFPTILTMIVRLWKILQNFTMRYFPTIFVDFQEIACSNQARNLRCGSLRIKSTWKFKRFWKKKCFLRWEYGELWVGGVHKEW